MAANSYDFIIVGGGLAGCTLASRLLQGAPELKILLVEAGEDASSNPMTQVPLACFGLHKSNLDWNYTTVPQTHLDEETRYAAAGKALGGGSVINYGTWTRGPKDEYDRWAKMVGDERWNYEHLLPYMKRTERHFASATANDVSILEHGHYGPIQTASVLSSSSDRIYPLRNVQVDAWKSLGITSVDDGNSGHPLGLTNLVENWRDGKRQITSSAYNLTGVEVMTNALVQKVLIDSSSTKPIATGIQLANGTEIHCTRSVIVCSGAYSKSIRTKHPPSMPS